MLQSGQALETAESDASVSQEAQEAANVKRYIELATMAHDVLKNEKDVSPRNLLINMTLSTFVLATMEPRPESEVQAILASPQIQKMTPDLRRLTGEAECAMERYCAQAFVGDIPVEKYGDYSSIQSFIYLKNYEVLIDKELKALGWPVKQPPIDDATQSIAFVGAGPLPISAILMHKRTGHPVTCIDSDEEAVRLGRKLIRHLSETDPDYKGLAENVRYHHANGVDHDYVTNPVIFIASLVPEKDAILMRIVNTIDTGRTIVIRSAEGLSTLLYPPHEANGGLEDYNVYLAKKTKPCPDAINTTLVFKYPPGKRRTRHKPYGDNIVTPTEGLDTLKKRPAAMWRTVGIDYEI